MLLPSEINVVTEIPKHKAEQGTLNYYMPTALQYDPDNYGYRKIKDYSRLVRDWLMEGVSRESLALAGLRMPPIPGGVVFENGFLSEASKDDLYQKGFNCIFNYVCHGPVIWGNMIAGDNICITLPDIVETVDCLILMDHALQSEKIGFTSVDRYRTGAQSLLSSKLTSKQIQGRIDSWLVAGQGYLTMQFTTGITPSTATVSTEYDSDYWYLDLEMSRRMQIIAKLYPKVFVQEASQVIKFGLRHLILYHNVYL